MMASLASTPTRASTSFSCGEPQSRDLSIELGSPSHITQVNKATGRPIRRNAGRKQSMAGYVDSSVIDDQFEPLELPPEDEEGEQIKGTRGKKRRRSPSPSPPPFEPISYFEQSDEDTDSEAGGMFHPHATTEPVTLQFNIPLGFHGPLLVKLNGNMLQASRVLNLRSPSTEVSSVTPSPTPSRGSITGFNDLPPEIRNTVYRLAFTTTGEFDMTRPSNFAKSAQFLRTCRLVHSEGCSVLYGENTFNFNRNRLQRSPFWESTPKEIGYRDVRQFLKIIGPENLAYLRDVKLMLEDASPSATPYLTHEDRRYLNDPQLIDCLRILRQAKLRKLVLTFLGRRNLLPTDFKFMGYLERIKADIVTTEPPNRWYFQKISPTAFDELKDAMTRKHKLYVDQ